ncbi:MAG: hypothetical protein KDM81_20565 [Verrucomicrobiae bacterium]|nr:hypothetical protein [Verrucomicrobiae bacterium]
MNIVHPARPSARGESGITLVATLVYLGAFLLIANMAVMAFFAVLEHVRGVRYETEQVTAALVAGERWRDDIRRATAPVQCVITNNLTLLRIPHGTHEVGYLAQDGEIFRRSRTNEFWQHILGPVSGADFIEGSRGGVRSWRWELRFPDRKARPRAPLAFTFQAVPAAP